MIAEQARGGGRVYIRGVQTNIIRKHPDWRSSGSAPAKQCHVLIYPICLRQGERYCFVIQRCYASLRLPEDRQPASRHRYMELQVSATSSQKLSLNNIVLFSLGSTLLVIFQTRDLFVFSKTSSRANYSEPHRCPAAVVRVLPSQG